MITIKKGWLALLLAASCLLAGCSKDTSQETAEVTPEPELVIQTSKDVLPPTEEATPEPTPEEEEEEEAPEGMVRSYLTGQFVPKEQGRRRPMAIMLSNIIDATPQSGISRAGVVYEAPVEGNITRLMGIFEEYDDLERIGSVRSCREYYIFFANEFNALYTHYGQAAYAVPFLEQDFVHNLSGLGAHGGDIFYRTTDRVPPHNAFTSFEGLQRGIKDYGYTQEYNEDYDGHYLFVKGEETTELQEADGAVTANKVTLGGFQHNNPWFEYDETTKKYKRFQFGKPHIDEMTGQQLEFDNILIQYTSYKPYDDHGYLNLDVISGGMGKYITHGKAIDVRWEKDKPWGITHYITPQNRELVMNTGKTIVEIVLDDSINMLTIE